MTTRTRTINDLGPHVSIRYPFRSKFVNVNGWRMHYIDEGPPNAPPVLLLHGNPTWGYLWRDTIPPLLAAGYRVIVPDQIGFGLSEHPHSAGAHSLDNHAANLVALLDQLDLNGVFFVCHDWGGPTALPGSTPFNLNGEPSLFAPKLSLLGRCATSGPVAHW